MPQLYLFRFRDETVCVRKSESEEREGRPTESSFAEEVPRALRPRSISWYRSISPDLAVPSFNLKEHNLLEFRPFVPSFIFHFRCNDDLWLHGFLITQFFMIYLQRNPNACGIPCRSQTLDPQQETLTLLAWKKPRQ